MSANVTESDIQGLLRDFECPYARYPNRGGDKAILVDDLIWFVRRRFGDVDDVELLDAAISAIGGKRTRMIDPWSAPRRFLRRLAGRAQASADVYEIPASFFESDSHAAEGG
jgi:hypothetical protein